MARPLHILVLDDSEADVKLMERVLRAGDVFFALRRVETRDEFLGALRSEEPDVVLVDYRLPHFDGLTALREAKKLRPGVPIIVVTGSLSDQLAVEFVQEGASDYIIKDRSSRLAVAVRRVVEEARAKMERREMEEKYKALLAGARAGLAIADCRTGRLSEYNDAFCRLTARSPAQLEAMTAWDIEPAMKDALSRAGEGRGFRLRTTLAGVPVDVSGTPLILGGKPHAQLALREALVGEH